MSKEIAGPIRFTAGGDNTGLLAHFMSEFLGRYPKVQIDVVLTPRRVDLLTEGFDLALRAGPLIDSSLVVRRLGRNDLRLFASSAYLRKAGKPQRVSDLARHRFVLFGDSPQREHLRLTGPEGDETVVVQGPLVVHEMSFAADAIAAGVGIGLVPETYFGWAAAMRANKATKGRSRSVRPDLVQVLPDYRLTGADVSLVSPPTAYEPRRVALFRDFLAERLRPLMQACTEAAEEERTSRRLNKQRASLSHPRQDA
jgi:DNA-binding transcriptional LysR family regulator